MHLFVEFRHFQSAATCYGMRQLSVYSLRVEDWIMLWFGCLFLCRVSGHLAGGVPGFLAGPALVCLFLLLLFVHDPNLFCHNTLGLSARYGQVCPAAADGCPLLFVLIFTRMSHVSQYTKGFAPIRELCTDFSPLINR